MALEEAAVKTMMITWKMSIRPPRVEELSPCRFLSRVSSQWLMVHDIKFSGSADATRFQPLTDCLIFALLLTLFELLQRPIK